MEPVTFTVERPNADQTLKGQVRVYVMVFCRARPQSGRFIQDMPDVNLCANRYNKAYRKTSGALILKSVILTVYDRALSPEEVKNVANFFERGELEKETSSEDVANC